MWFNIKFEVEMFCTRIKSFYFYFKYGIENLIEWFPLIWADRDWDHNYLIEILRFKLSKMSKLHKDYGNCVQSPTYAKQLKICSILCQRLLDKKYVTEEMDKLFVRKMNYNVSPIDTGIDDHDKFRRLANKEKLMEKQDLELLTKMINKHLTKWWD